MPMLRLSWLLSLTLLAPLAACDDGGDDGGDDTPMPDAATGGADAAPGTPDAAPGTPDAAPAIKSVA